MGGRKKKQRCRRSFPHRPPGLTQNSLRIAPSGLVIPVSDQIAPTQLLNDLLSEFEPTSMTPEKLTVGTEPWESGSDHRYRA